ncbi:MAG: hypothetical protein AAGG56_01985 [Pseudomonadota bacterium]
MLLEHTISQLDIGPLPEARARELGNLGYMQWLAGLPTMSDYAFEAMRAYDMALPFRRNSPAIVVFCDLLVASTRLPLEPLPLTLPRPRRRGGADARRSTL